MSLRMPAEHGAWGMLLVPLASAALVSGVWNLPLLLVSVAALGLFLLRGSVEAYGGWGEIRRPAHLALAGVCLAAAGALLLVYARTELMGVAAAGAILYAVQAGLAKRPAPVPGAGAEPQPRAEKRSLAAELAGVVLLSLAAPAAWIAARGGLDAQGAAVWLLNVLFFLGGVLYVKYRVRGLLAHRAFPGWRERVVFAWPVFAYHTLLAVLLGGWILLEGASPAVGVAFLPAVLRANCLVFHLGRRFPIRRLGWMEMAQSLAFAVLLVLALR